MRDSRDIRGLQCGNVKFLRGPPPVFWYQSPREQIEQRDPVLADLLEQSLNGKHVDLRKHLTGR